MAKKIRFEVPNHKKTTKHNFVATWAFTDGSPHKWNFTIFYWVVFRNICNTNIFINILLSYLITFVTSEYFVLKNLQWLEPQTLCTNADSYMCTVEQPLTETFCKHALPAHTNSTSSRHPMLSGQFSNHQRTQINSSV